MWHFQNCLLCSNYFTCIVTNNKSYPCWLVWAVLICKNCLEQYISSAVDFKSHFKINKHNIIPTMIDVELKDILMVNAKILTICFSLFKLQNRCMKIPKIWMNCCGTGTNIGKANSLLLTWHESFNWFLLSQA